MTTFEMHENGKDENGTPRCDLYIDGEKKNSTSYNQVIKLVRQKIRPGDTFQEINEDAPNSDVFTYEQMKEMQKREEAWLKGERV